jgi:D-serine dehydratase
MDKNRDGVLYKLRSTDECLYINSTVSENYNGELSIVDIYDAEARLNRFAPVLKKLFPELEKSKGIIESEIIEIPAFKNYLLEEYDLSINNLYIKADHSLPVSGSVKARGGIYSVLCIIEKVALKEKILSSFDDDYLKLCEDKVKEIFKCYTLSVGSTGNLGLSIGISGKAFGFNVEVHMSSDAKEWKKNKLRGLGVKVIEYDDDYLYACSVARTNAEKDSNNYFIDDENSKELFFGYSVAALRLKKQLEEKKITVSAEKPLFVYLPCGVGGAPGGITFGLKLLFGNNVYCFFAEPVQAPCVTLGLVSGKHSEISVYDIGLTGKTDADGLAVGRASKFVSEVMENILDGCYTVEDEKLYKLLYKLYETEKIKVEPSAAAAFYGSVMIDKSGNNLLRSNKTRPFGLGQRQLALPYWRFDNK